MMVSLLGLRRGDFHPFHVVWVGANGRGAFGFRRRFLGWGDECHRHRHDGHPSVHTVG